MFDEFPTEGRLDFFESSLPFMAGYGLKCFLIAQSLNQIEKAYGPNNAIVDNCHVRVSFATNDERTAKRVSDALGTATEMRAMKNYAGHRLSPWLGHLMVSRSETARQLLTPGEIMQLPPDDEIVMVAGVPPIRAKKARYFEDRQLAERILAPPTLKSADPGSLPVDDWMNLLAPIKATGSATQGAPAPEPAEADSDRANAGIRREPELPRHEDIAPQPLRPMREFSFADDGASVAAAARARKVQERMRGNARQASLDPDDGIKL